MNNEVTHLAPGEVRQFVGQLRAPDILRLSALARNWATGLRQHDADDLLNEALARILSGRRPWPCDVPWPAFVSQVMRSIASQWRQENRREPLREDETDHVFEEETHDPGAEYEMDDLATRMRQALADDPAALGVLDHVLADSDGEEARTAVGMDVTEYNTARRRMVRHLFRAFNAGWTS